METKENLLHLFWNCNLVLKKNWFAVNFFFNDLWYFSAREITLGISESYIENQNTVNNILLILECYIYKCRCKGGKSTLTQRSSIPKTLYLNRDKLHFLHVPKTDSKLIKNGLILMWQ
jgi:hypothetical protein